MDSWTTEVVLRFFVFFIIGVSCFRFCSSTPFLPPTHLTLPTLVPFFSPPCCPHLPSNSCVHYSCEAIDCQEPLIRNAELRCSSTGRHFYNGDRCTISCNSGYNLQIHQDDDIIKSQVNIPRPNYSLPIPRTQIREEGRRRACTPANT